MRIVPRRRGHAARPHRFRADDPRESSCGGEIARQGAAAIYLRAGRGQGADDTVPRSTRTGRGGLRVDPLALARYVDLITRQLIAIVLATPRRIARATRHCSRRCAISSGHEAYASFSATWNATGRCAGWSRGDRARRCTSVARQAWGGSMTCLWSCAAVAARAGTGRRVSGALPHDPLEADPACECRERCPASCES